LALTKYKAWYHAIDLEEEKEPTQTPIYPLSEKELGVLREYLRDNLAKDYIRPSKSPAGHPIIFVKKTRRLLTVMRRLSKAKRENEKEQVPSFSDRRYSAKSRGSKMVYELRPT
jgi:hypothetical protein